MNRSFNLRQVNFPSPIIQRQLPAVSSSGLPHSFLITMSESTSKSDSSDATEIISKLEQSAIKSDSPGSGSSTTEGTHLDPMGENKEKESEALSLTTMDRENKAGNGDHQQYNNNNDDQNSVLGVNVTLVDQTKHSEQDPIQHVEQDLSMRTEPVQQIYPTVPQQCPVTTENSDLIQMQPLLPGLPQIMRAPPEEYLYPHFPHHHHHHGHLSLPNPSSHMAAGEMYYPEDLSFAPVDIQMVPNPRHWRAASVNERGNY